MQVLNIRGTTGSGKTTIVRNLIHIADMKQLISISEGVKGHLLHFHQKPDVPCIVIGEYKKDSNFGGVDAIAKISYVEPAIWRALEIAPVVVFEGLLISHSYDRWKNFSDELLGKQVDLKEADHGMMWCFTLPKLRENLKRLKKRNRIVGKTLREAKGDKYILNFIDRYKSITRIYKKAVKDDQTIYMVDGFSDFAKQWFFPTLQDPGSKLKKSKKKTGIERYL
jgi:hypothetical protein